MFAELRAGGQYAKAVAGVPVESVRDLGESSATSIRTLFHGVEGLTEGTPRECAGCLCLVAPRQAFISLPRELLLVLQSALSACTQSLVKPCACCSLPAH